MNAIISQPWEFRKAGKFLDKKRGDMPKRELTTEELALRAGLGAAIRAASGQKGLKPADLAAAAGVALSQQYRIENGELTADFLYLVKVSRLLDLSLDALIHAAQDAAERVDLPRTISVRGNNNIVAGRDVVGVKPSPIPIQPMQPKIKRS